MPPSQKKAAKKQKTAEKAEKAPPPKKKKSTAIVEYDRMSRVWIYQIIDPETKKVIYIGRTKNLQNRVQQHDQESSACTQLKEYIRLHNFTVKGNIFVVPELPEGVPFYRAAEFEGVFIVKRKTLFDPETRPDGCNLKHGDNITGVNVADVWAEVQAGYKWPEASKNTPSSAELLQAESEVAILEDMVKAVGDVEPTLSDDLRLAKSNLAHLQRTQLGITELCEAFAADYEKLPRDEVVPRSGAIIGMNLVKEKLEAEEERDEPMLALIRAEHLFLFESKTRVWNMTAHVAAYTFHRLAGVLESREIERMEKTTAVKKMLEVREWSYAHGQTMPKNRDSKKKKKTEVEKSLGNFLNNLKAGRRYYQGSDAECAFLMRNLPAYAAFLAYSKAKTGADSETNLKQLLADGYGLASEPAFEGKKTLEESEHPAEFAKLRHLTRGVYDEETTDRILAGLPASRIAFYKGPDFATKRAEYLKKEAERPSRKRTHVETEEEAETEEPEEDKAEEEESDDEDEGSDEDEESGEEEDE
jgi:hypothetical protein